jgi:hypothetical protein
VAKGQRIAENIFDAASAALEEPVRKTILKALVDDLADLDKKYLALLLDRGPMSHAAAAKVLGIPETQVAEIAEDLAQAIVKAFADLDTGD